MLSSSLRRIPRSACRACSSSTTVPARPNAHQLQEKDVKFDAVTHTGQAWDQTDVRLARFTYVDKQVNPNVAMHLVAEVPPIVSKARVVGCDGGGGALGHPKIFINLDKPGNHACSYCGLRFTLEGNAASDTHHANV